jgi:dihydrofolate reductase
LTFGSGELVYRLMQHALINEYRIMLFPIVVGSGKLLFRHGSDPKTLKLVDTNPFGSASSYFATSR